MNTKTTRSPWCFPLTNHKRILSFFLCLLPHREASRWDWRSTAVTASGNNRHRRRLCPVTLRPSDPLTRPQLLTHFKPSMIQLAKPLLAHVKAHADDLHPSIVNKTGEGPRRAPQRGVIIDSRILGPLSTWAQSLITTSSVCLSATITTACDAFAQSHCGSHLPLTMLPSIHAGEATSSCHPSSVEMTKKWAPSLLFRMYCQRGIFRRMSRGRGRRVFGLDYLRWAEVGLLNSPVYE